MKKFLLSLGLLINVAYSQTVQTRWTDQFTKELVISCSTGDFCQNLCGQTPCILEEGICHNCIGTGFQIFQLFSELGKSIKRGEEIESAHTLDLLLMGNFVTFSANDVYNVIDPANSISAYRKFESLCPGESVNQLIFLAVDQLSRKLLAPFSVYCEYAEESLFFELK